MNPFLIDCIGYGGLVINLYSMSTKGEYKLRLISLIANAVYILYGTIISATPIIVGCTIAVFLHGYHLRRLTIKKDGK
ncbi:hypothetical protein J8L88_14160 [Aquimarina sp. MMG015]|uniref:hypothetical protein n=1 Tax=Aquimarina TaxID=290174 RepID=UPI000483AEB2|nr:MULTISPECIES: hypothetical protein [Aquimarina]AXT54458.1 hypothetical protein D1815_01370 [Aquimarina sp. AD1]MBQ4804001.1 hypothetical protein [Aquimarina sp. MMG015]RKN36758.1 hypothetical protein D7035_02195 [Aquimarina sp. AD1]